VRVVQELDGLHGLAEIGDGRCLITLVSDQDSVMIDTLVEEWSHCLRHEVPVEVEDEHDGLFWQIYGQITMRWRG